MTSANRNTHRLRNFIAILAFLCGFASAAAWLINRPAVLKSTLALINARSEWRTDIGKFKIRLLEGNLDLGNISITQRNKGVKLQIHSVNVGLDYFGLLKGKVVIDGISVDGAMVEIASIDTHETERKRKRFDIARLILLKNLELKSGRVNQLHISLGDGTLIAADKAHLSMKSSILGGTSLDFRTDGVFLNKPDKTILSAGTLGLKTSTDLSRWHKKFPYINNLDGALKALDVNIEGLAIDEIGAGITYKDNQLDLGKLAIAIGDKQLIGSFFANTSDERFEISIDILKHIYLPHIGKKMKTMDTSGALAGSVRLKGTGLIPSETTGSGFVDLEHRFDASPEHPVSIKGNISWKKGAIYLSNTKVHAGQDEIDLSGSIDISNKKIKLSASAKQFPIEHVFNKFNNEQLRKIFGVTDVDATFEGWGKNFIAKVSGTTSRGGWKPIVAETINSELKATYNTLELTSVIFTDKKRTGSADLVIHFGPKAGDNPRSKKFDLNGEINGHPLNLTLEEYRIRGIGDGMIRMGGPQASFKGEAAFSIRNGAWHEVPFDKASAKIDISGKHLIFSDMKILLPKQEPNITGEIVADFSEGQVRLHGNPAEGLDVDAAYRYADNRWTIKEISWRDPDHENMRIAASGSLSSDGPTDIRLKGSMDLELFSFFLPSIRGGSGPIDIDLKAGGSTGDPKCFGSVVFNKNSLSLRGAQLVLEQLDGSLKFNGNRIIFEGITADADGGKLNLSGSLDHKSLKPYSADLRLVGDAMRYRSPDRTLNLEFEGTIELKGLFPAPLFKGDITILEGRYTKDFNIIDVISRKKEPSSPVKKYGDGVFNPTLDLHVKNTGDLAIKNNVGDIWFNINAEVRGTKTKPIVSGTIDTQGGEVHYLGVNFEVTKGFMEFREKYEEPYLEVHAQKEIGVYNVNLVLHGFIDNLALDLSATSPSGPLEKRDVISLILFGATEQERTLASHKAGQQFTTSLAAQSVSSVAGGPIAKFSRLDVFRLEAADPSSPHISRLYVGKQLSDRLSLNFATDINSNEAVQTIIAEYQLMDHIILRGARSTDARSEISGLLRFKMR